MNSAFWWVVLSNIAYLAPLAWLLKQRRLGDAVHAVLVALVTFTSTVYHVCDPATGTAGAPLTCILPFVDLYMLDLALALLLAVSVTTFRLPLESVWVRECALLLTLALALYVNFASSAGYNSPAFYLVGALVALLVVVYRGAWESFQWNRWLFIAVALGASAFVFFGLDERFYYLELHGCWHLLSALAVLCAYLWFDRQDEYQKLDVYRHPTRERRYKRVTFNRL